MPIYEYRCEACGHHDEHLQKVSEAPLANCPACGKATYRKQLSAAGFQLKGSGWYATDFKAAPKSAAKSGEAKATETKTESKPESKSESKPAGGGETKSEAKPKAA